MAELVRLFFGELKEKGDEELAKKAFRECQDYTAKRDRCWNTLAEENRNQDCFQEELAEKKCLALCLCPELYKKFYEYTECHLWAAAFRNKDDVRYIEARNKINNNPDMATMCRVKIFKYRQISLHTSHSQASLEVSFFILIPSPAF